MRPTIAQAVVLTLGLAGSVPASLQTSDENEGPHATIVSIGAVGAEGTRVVTRRYPTAIPDVGCTMESTLPAAKTVTFVVAPEDRHYFTYRFARFDGGGYGFYPATADEFGIIQGNDGGQRIVDMVAECNGQARQSTREEEPEHHYLVATDIDTGVQYYTFDLPQIRLSSFLMSLQGSLTSSRPPRSAPREEMLAWMRNRREIMQQNGMATRDVFIALLGEKLPLDLVLDEIYIKTGCYVSEVDGFLVVENC